MVHKQRQTSIRVPTILRRGSPAKPARLKLERGASCCCRRLAWGEPNENLHAVTDSDAYLYISTWQRIMVELYLDATLHNQISVEHYREVLLNRGLDEQDQKLRSNLLKRVEAGTIQLSSWLIWSGWLHVSNEWSSLLESGCRNIFIGAELFTRLANSKTLNSDIDFSQVIQLEIN